MTVCTPAGDASSATDFTARAIAHVDAERDVGVEEVILEPPAIDLERAERRKLHRSDLEPLRDVAVAVLREEIAQPELRELMLGHVAAEAEHVAEVAARDFDRRFADLEGRLADGMGAFFEDQQADVRALALQLSRETQAGKAAAEDDDVVGSMRGHAVCMWRWRPSVVTAANLPRGRPAGYSMTLTCAAEMGPVPPPGSRSRP